MTAAQKRLGTARRMAEEAKGSVLAARRLNLLDEVVAQITAAGGTAMACSCDVSDEESVRQLVATTVQAYGKLDIVVNNAVLMVPGMLANHSTKAWHQNFRVSLDGALFLMRESFTPAQGQRWGGRQCRFSVRPAGVGGHCRLQRGQSRHDCPVAQCRH